MHANGRWDLIRRRVGRKELRFYICAHHVSARGSGGLTPLNGVLSFTHRPLYVREKESSCLSNSRRGGAKSRFGHSVEEIN